MGSHTLTVAESRSQAAALRYETDYDQARLLWRRSLNDTQLRSFAEDYRNGLRGEDIEDAWREFLFRYPGKKPGRGNRTNSANNLPKVPKNKLPRCDEHTDHKPAYARRCPECIRLLVERSESASPAPVDESMSDSAPIM